MIFRGVKDLTVKYLEDLSKLLDRTKETLGEATQVIEAAERRILQLEQELEEVKDLYHEAQRDLRQVRAENQALQQQTDRLRRL